MSPDCARCKELEALLAQLVGVLDDLQDHHCGGMCARDHERVMDKVNAVLAAAASYLPGGRPHAE